MSVREIIEYPDPRLSRPAAAVATFDTAFARFVDDLVETLAATPGVGLSAPQVGASHAVFALEQEQGGTRIYVNPEILTRAGFCVVEEQCLSVPGVKANIFRAPAIRIRAEDENGERFEEELSGMPAVCFQHELDHLEGRLFVDRLSSIRRWWVTSRMRSAPSESRLSS